MSSSAIASAVPVQAAALNQRHIDVTLKLTPPRDDQHRGAGTDMTGLPLCAIRTLMMPFATTISFEVCVPPRHYHILENLNQKR